MTQSNVNPVQPRRQPELNVVYHVTINEVLKIES
jgi:hypothetical protein